MSLSRKTDGRHSNGRNSSPSPHKSFLRQMIPFQVDNRPTSQLSFSPLTVSVRCHSQRGEMWQTWQWDNILQPKGGALLGSVTHFHDSFISPSCRKMPDYHSCSLDSCFCIITSSFKLKPVRSTFVYVKLHSRASCGSVGGGGCKLVIEGLAIPTPTVHTLKCPWARHWNSPKLLPMGAPCMAAAIHWCMRIGEKEAILKSLRTLWRCQKALIKCSLLTI